MRGVLITLSMFALAILCMLAPVLIDARHWYPWWWHKKRTK